MKIIILIFTLLISLNIYAQKLPITGLCWGDVFTATGTTCSTDAFSAANPVYFDPTYAVAGNCLDDFRNYGHPAVLALLEITSLYGATTTSIIADVSISSDGGSTITTKGICWAKIPTLPTTANSHTNEGSGSSDFTSMATGLTAGDTINFRPYAINSAGTAYGTTWGYIIPTECTTRPTGLTNANFYTRVNGVSINSTNGCFNLTITCGGGCTYSAGQSSMSEGSDVYLGTGTDCTKLWDGYYVMVIGASSYAVQILDGKLYYTYC